MNREQRRPAKRPPPDPAGRVPPHDLQAEAAVLSAAMLDQDALDAVLPLLQPADFYSNANELVFEGAVALHDQGVKVDVVSIAGWLRDREQIQRIGGARYLTQLVDATPAVAHVVDHARRVREKSQLRKAIICWRESAAAAYGDVGDTADFLDQAEQQLSDITHRPEETEAVELKDALADTFAEMAATAERGDKISGISTGFVDLDRKLAGLHKGDLVLIGARPGAGKSALASNIAINVPESGEDAVALFSLEMPKAQITVRLACSEARVDMSRVRDGTLSEADWAQLTAAAARMANSPVLIDDNPRLTLSTLKAKVRRLARQIKRKPVKKGEKPRKLTVVVIDYLQLMETPKAESREQRVAAVLRGLKLLAKELDMAVILLVQLNRGLEARSIKEKRPRLSDIRETGAAEQDADVVLFIHRPEMYEPGKAGLRGLAEVLIAKQRNGPTGCVRMRWSGYCTRFDTLAGGDYDDVDWGADD